MRTKALTLSCIILIMLTGQTFPQQPSNESPIPEKAVDKFRQDFWMTSKTAFGEKYLIKVKLPRSYFKSDTTQYPVFYLTDADLFFGTASDCAYWVGRAKREIILVGISYGSPEACWEKRMLDFRSSPNPDNNNLIGASRFLSFFREELIQKIESEFRVDNTNRTLFGWSGGAIFVTYVITEQPELFNNYLSGGGNPPKGWVDKIFEKRKDLPIRYFIANGEIDPYAQKFQEFIQDLKAKNFEGLEFEWQVFKGKRHEYKTVADVIKYGMDFIYGNKSIITAMINVLNEKDIESAIAEYHRLKATNPDGYNFRGGKELNFLARGLSVQQRYDEAVEINKLNIRENPDYWLAYYKVGSYYMYEGENKLAAKYFSKALELNPGHEESIKRLKKVQGN